MAKPLYAAIAYVVALGCAAAIFLLLAPEAWLQQLGLVATPEPAQTTGGWGAAATPTAPADDTPEAIPLAWMAWTAETAAFFIFVVMCLSLMTAREFVSPGGHPRRGALGLDTTRGDRLFITLLGSAFIFLAWLLAIGTPLWGGLAIAVIWAIFVFGWV
ncbi:MAG: DUF2160 domain-containing protein [Pseudomonadota bacterium]